MPVTKSSHETHSSASNPAHGGLIIAAPRRRGFLANLGWFGVLAIAAVVVIGGLGFLKYSQFAKMQALAASGAFLPPPVAVTTVTVHAQQWQPTLHAIGSVEAVQGTNISADLPGIVKEIAFQSGQTVKKGDILVRLVTDQEQAQLEANQAQRDLAVYTLKRQKDLRDKNTNSQSDFDNAEAGERQTEAMVDNARAAIDRKTIRAPFAGVLGIRKVNVGQYLDSGNQIVTLQSMDPIYVNFTLPQQNLRDFAVGSTVDVTTDATDDQLFTGKVTAVESLVDNATRNFQAQATLSNPDGKLRPGMFATVDVLVGGNGSVLPVPGSAINYAPYGDSVFVIVHNVSQPADPTKPDGPKKTVPLAVEQRFVTTGQTKGDLVAVLKGLKEGDEIVSSGVFKLQNNSLVQINNNVKPEADADPHPDES